MLFLFLLSSFILVGISSPSSLALSSLISLLTSPDRPLDLFSLVRTTPNDGQHFSSPRFPLLWVCWAQGFFPVKGFLNFFITYPPYTLCSSHVISRNLILVNFGPTRFYPTDSPAQLENRTHSKSRQKMGRIGPCVIKRILGRMDGFGPKSDPARPFFQP